MKIQMSPAKVDIRVTDIRLFGSFVMSLDLPNLRPLVLEEETNPGIRALQRASRIAEEYGISDMTLEEINAEIAEARK